MSTISVVWVEWIIYKDGERLIVSYYLSVVNNGTYNLVFCAKVQGKICNFFKLSVGAPEPEVMAGT